MKPLSLVSREGQLRVQFVVYCPDVHWGTSVWVVGSASELGEWKPVGALPLTYAENNWWKSTEVLIDIAKYSAPVEYKYLTRNEPTHQFSWEPTPNREIASLEACLLVDGWGQESSRRPVKMGSLTTLQVMSFNVRFDSPEDRHQWTDRKHVIKDIIVARSPDVVGLQEPLHNQLEDMKDLLPEYTFIGEARSPGGEYCSLLLKKSSFLYHSFWYLLALRDTKRTMQQELGLSLYSGMHLGTCL